MLYCLPHTSTAPQGLPRLAGTAWPEALASKSEAEEKSGDEQASAD
jgi:hypothetical protein